MDPNHPMFKSDGATPPVPCLTLPVCLSNRGDLLLSRAHRATG
jgi:hypothetical protein